MIKQSKSEVDRNVYNVYIGMIELFLYWVVYNKIKTEYYFQMQFEWQLSSYLTSLNNDKYYICMFD